MTKRGGNENTGGDAESHQNPSSSPSLAMESNSFRPSPSPSPAMEALKQETKPNVMEISLERWGKEEGAEDEDDGGGPATARDGSDR
ncbi:hypothetical protein L6452_01076 [Arctium lappa]|uniref:Uncharacterized protein n=1 Tax=Arctium lappa TaxID=4217 RepID=A0ACB9FF49_ARCLA|nr:hypothetical protein L6452_01076 [Arctium lappa]